MPRMRAEEPKEIGVPSMVVAGALRVSVALGRTS